MPIYCWSCPLLNCRYIIFMVYSKLCCMLQVAQLAGQLDSLLDGPNVSQAVGQKIINIISNLMNASPAVLLASSNRFQLTCPHQHQHINTSDFSKMFFVIFTVDRLIHMVDKLGVKLDVTGGTGVLSSDSLVLAVRTVDPSNFPATSVDIFNTDNVQVAQIP